MGETPLSRVASSAYHSENSSRSLHILPSPRRPMRGTRAAWSTTGSLLRSPTPSADMLWLSFSLFIVLDMVPVSNGTGHPQTGLIGCRRKHWIDLESLDRSGGLLSFLFPGTPASIHRCEPVNHASVPEPTKEWGFSDKTRRATTAGQGSRLFPSTPLGPLPLRICQRSENIGLAVCHPRKIILLGAETEKCAIVWCDPKRWWENSLFNKMHTTVAIHYECVSELAKVRHRARVLVTPRTLPVGHMRRDLCPKTVHPPMLLVWSWLVLCRCINWQRHTPTHQDGSHFEPHLPVDMHLASPSLQPVKLSVISLLHRTHVSPVLAQNLASCARALNT